MISRDIFSVANMASGVFFIVASFPVLSLTESHLAEANYPSLCVLSLLLSMSLCVPLYEPRQAKKWLRVLPTNRENHQNVTVGKILLERDSENIHFQVLVCKRMKRESFLCLSNTSSVFPLSSLWGFLSVARHRNGASRECGGKQDDILYPCAPKPTSRGRVAHAKWLCFLSWPRLERRV